MGTAEMFRGVKQTLDGPAAEGLAQYDFDNGAYGALWAGRIEFPYSNEGSDLEVDYIAGVGRALTTRLFLDSAIIRYSYPTSHLPRNYDWTEWYNSAHLFERWSVGVGVGRDWLGSGRTTLNVELSYRQPLPLGLVADVTGGHQQVPQDLGRDYEYFELGIGRTLHGVQVRIAYGGTDSDGEYLFGQAAGRRWLGKLTWAF